MGRSDPNSQNQGIDGIFQANLFTRPNRRILLLRGTVDPTANRRDGSNCDIDQPKENVMPVLLVPILVGIPVVLVGGYWIVHAHPLVSGGTSHAVTGVMV
jgi:hypothetical protein